MLHAGKIGEALSDTRTHAILLPGGSNNEEDATVSMLLTGCAQSIIPNGQPFIVDSSPHQVSVSRARMIGSSGMLQLADAHCAKYGKHAEYIGGNDTFVSNYRCAKD